MKNKIYLVLILLLSFIFIGEVKANSYSINYFDTNIGVNGFTSSNVQVMNNYKSVDLQFNNNNYFSTVYFNELYGGITIENNVNSFTFPFSITDLVHNSQKLTCSIYTTTQTSYTISYQTEYADGTTSQNDGVINENTGTALCQQFKVDENNDYSVNIGYQLSDNTTYNCLVTEVNGGNQALCPIQQSKANGNYKITQIFIVFTRNNSDNNTKVRVRLSMNIIKQIDTQQETNNKLDKIDTSINSSNTSGGESAADDLKNNSAFQDNSGLSSVVSMPLTFVNSLSNTCQPISINIPYFDVDMQIPCFQSIITEKMPALANIIKVVINGFIIYRVLLDIFQIIRNAKNPEDDRIEVLDL